MSSVSWDDSIHRFLHQAGSSDPTPGGGSVAALVAALGASMTAMAGSLSQGEKFAAHEAQIQETLSKMRYLSTASEELLHADIESFNGYMTALKLPKSTEDEKASRKLALESATIHAIEVPLRLMRLCRDGIISTAAIADSANKHVISDLGIGAILFEAAARSALLTVEINLRSMPESAIKNRYAEQAAALMDETERRSKAILHTARQRM
ncbi:methenyltetrahydrofolate cyclohydrolase [Paenibacillus sp. 1011MAR3C5]|uniref:cyclodeaminase/cyclohydrolase family protein n=1 Tax=Paenibacillus sp. 1011MAR3C5 TaxID=1675787 RepID=UPI000E6CAE24|nr:cyclodeaminase/cyclohydrolase family protein [Paenibacillus sp. 1011MAR3C5]RJE87486.1 methenyltetrahydrofolate cyclohydrolase [Paenibacillus sp. 1011MAR3C5]